MYHELKELKASSSHKDSPGVRELQSLYGSHRTQHRKLIRSFKAADSIARDASLMTNPSATFSRIRSSNKASAGKLSKLIVGDKAFIGDRVPDGFYAAMKDLKMRDYDKLKTSPHFHDFSCDYMNILKLSKSSKGIKPITESESLQILQSMKSDVLDFFSVSPNHYLHAGPAGCRHFHSLMKALLSDVGTTAIHEVNAAYACILFKGHGKDRTSSRSYRTISTCPVVAKGLDLYIRKIHGHSWKNAQPSTQFQGEGSSHELAAVLLTECIQFSRFTLKKPLYVLYLDAKSAFDGVLRELLIKNLYEVQELDKSLLLINNRLENRSTFLDWDGNLVGPIHDQQGLEQGGCNSSEFYKIFAKEQLNLVQKTNFGVYFGQNLVISGIGQADDLALLSNDLHKLYYLLNLTIISCQKYNIELCAEKTRLQAFLPTNGALDYDIFNPIKINDVQIEFATTAEHVGILRAIDGNRSAILARLTAHKRALGAILHVGLSRGHRGNPAASLALHRLYGTPVLLSGLAALCLSDTEIDMIERHYKETLQRLMRLHKKTPRSVVYFLAGSIPGCALLHTRQLCLFGMISRLEDSLIKSLAVNAYSCGNISKRSWFYQIRKLCLMYCLPHPLDLLQASPTKTIFKTLAKKKVLSYWEVRLRAEAAELSSLGFFHPEYISLNKPHPIWSSAGSSPSKVSMALVQATMISGRYRTEALASHWSPTSTGCCILSPQCVDTREDLHHVLQTCHALTQTRSNLQNFTVSYVTKKMLPKNLADFIIDNCSPSSSSYCQFLLDCTSLPSVILLVQSLGPSVLPTLLDVTRTWIYVIHRERLKRLGRWTPG